MQSYSYGSRPVKNVHQAAEMARPHVKAAIAGAVPDIGTLQGGN